MLEKTQSASGCALYSSKAKSSWGLFLSLLVPKPHLHWTYSGSIASSGLVVWFPRPEPTFVIGKHKAQPVALAFFYSESVMGLGLVCFLGKNHIFIGNTQSATGCALCFATVKASLFFLVRPRPKPNFSLEQHKEQAVALCAYLYLDCKHVFRTHLYVCVYTINTIIIYICMYTLAYQTLLFCRFLL